MAELANSIFEKSVDAGASDVHLLVGAPIMFRIDGELIPQTKEDITAAEAEALVREVVGESVFERLSKEREIDVSYALDNGVRLRVNCHYERDVVGMVARVIPNDIPTLEDISLRETAEHFLHFREGLILFTGPTGTGKSTSLASVIQHINMNRAESIITLEDPIEFIFPKGKSIIRQRQFGHDFLEFGEALRRVLRQDPNIIMVGEMRDPETIATAITAAETGILVMSTLHTTGAAQSVDRILDAFPHEQQHQSRFVAMGENELMTLVGGEERSLEYIDQGDGESKRRSEIDQLLQEGVERRIGLTRVGRRPQVGVEAGAGQPVDVARLDLDRIAGDVADQHRRCRAGDAVHVVMLRDPVALVAEPLRMPGEVEAVAQRLARRRARRDRREVEDRK